MRRFLPGLLAGLLGLAAAAAPPLTLGSGGRQPLAGHLDMLTGPPVSTLDEALQAAAEGRFRPIPGNAAEGYGPHDVWLRFTLDVPAGASQEALLEVGPASLQQVTLHQPLLGGGYRASVTGAGLPFRERSFSHPNLLFRLGGAVHPLPGPSATCYLQVRTRSARLARPILWSPEAYGAASSLESLLHGAFLGITFILMIANAVYGIRLRAATQLTYAGYLASMILMFAGLEGLAGQFLFPGSTTASRTLVPIAISLQPWFAVALFSSLTEFGKAYPRMDRAYRRFGAGTTIVLLAASFAGRYYDLAVAGQTAIVAIVVANAAGAAHMAFRRSRTALLYLLAFGPFLAAALFRLGRALGWTPTDFLAGHGLHIAALFHFCLMNLPLAEHMARIRRERDEALRSALQVKEDIQRRLEEVVEARTRELREEQARTQQALERERQIVAEQGQFLSMVSHEFRTPLAVIDGAAQIARLTAPDDPQEVAHRMGTVQRSVRRLLHLLDTWIVQDRITSRRLEMRSEPIELADLMTDLAQQTREAAPDREVLLSLDPDLPRIDGDPAMLATALHNLLDNALKYSPEGSPVHLRALLRAPWIRLEVEDHGQGIPADQAQAVRSRYVRGRNAGRTPGLGLGLHLVETIAGRHGGRFDLETGEGRGALARISLPCAKRPAS